MLNNIIVLNIQARLSSSKPLPHHSGIGMAAIPKIIDRLTSDSQQKKKQKFNRLNLGSKDQRKTKKMGIERFTNIETHKKETAWEIRPSVRERKRHLLYISNGKQIRVI